MNMFNSREPFLDGSKRPTTLKLHYQPTFYYVKLLEVIKIQSRNDVM